MNKTLRRVVTPLLLLGGLLPLAVLAQSEALTPPMRAHFDQAVELLNRYRGDTALLESARVELGAVLQAHPRHAPSYREMARYQIMRGHVGSARFQPGALETADALITRALEIEPAFAEAYVLRGHLFKLMHRHQDAVAALLQAERIGTGDPWLHNNWADLLIEEGRYDEAARHYREVIDGSTTNRKARAAAFEGLIRYCELTGQLPQADELHRQLLDLEADSAWRYGSYAHFLLCVLDEPEQAVARARQALQRMDYAVGRAWLAAGLYRLWSKEVLAGTPEHGQIYLAEAQTLEPDIEAVTRRARACAPLASVAKALAVGRGDLDAAAEPPLARVARAY